MSHDLLELLRARNGLCAVFVELLLARRDGAPDMEARLVRADSAVRHYLANTLDVFGYEDLVLARLWAERGDTTRALASLRLYRYGFCCHWTAATGAREEGRLAALQGHTARAIRAYRRYLDLRRDARPELVPQRDSVQAALALLERR